MAIWMIIERLSVFESSLIPGAMYEFRHALIVSAYGLLPSDDTRSGFWHVVRNSALS